MYRWYIAYEGVLQMKNILDFDPILAMTGVIMGVLVGIVLLLVIVVVGIFNGLVGLRNRVKNAYAQIDVQL